DARVCIIGENGTTAPDPQYTCAWRNAIWYGFPAVRQAQQPRVWARGIQAGLRDGTFRRTRSATAAMKVSLLSNSEKSISPIAIYLNIYHREQTRRNRAQLTNPG